jgi:hypothetical protein
VLTFNRFDWATVALAAAVGGGVAAAQAVRWPGGAGAALTVGARVGGRPGRPLAGPDRGPGDRPMPFLTDTEFRQSLADTLKVNAAELGGYWDRLCQEAHLSAYRDVRGALLMRGFAPGQIDQWDRGAEFERDLGLYWALVRGSNVHSFDQTAIDRLDRRKELETVMVELAGGAPQVPAGTPPRIEFGVLSTTDADGNDDRWTKDTPL